MTARVGVGDCRSSGRVRPWLLRQSSQRLPEAGLAGGDADATIGNPRPDPTGLDGTGLRMGPLCGDRGLLHPAAASSNTLATAGTTTLVRPAGIGSSPCARCSRTYLRP